MIVAWEPLITRRICNGIQLHLREGLKKSSKSETASLFHGLKNTTPAHPHKPFFCLCTRNPGQEI